MQSHLIAKRLVQVSAVLAVAVLAVGQPSAPAFAQSKKELQEQINRLERDLKDVERLIYRGGATGSAGTPSAAPGANGSNQFADIQVHFNSVEDQLRALTGQLETANHQIQVLSNRLDKLQQDVEFRLNALEHGGQPASGAGGAPQGGAPSAAPSQSGQLVPPPGAKPTPQTANSSPEPLPTGGVQVVYDHALGALRAGDYSEAERGFKGLVSRDPKAELAANAQYWLGETYYVRKMYSDAAAAFLKAYQDYPKGPKRPDSLLKLGMSLKGLGQKTAACDSFSELLTKYPMASKSIRSRAQSERKDAGCS
jgi:tol-pal system protein YbgF